MSAQDSLEREIRYLMQRRDDCIHWTYEDASIEQCYKCSSDEYVLKQLRDKLRKIHTEQGESK